MIYPSIQCLHCPPHLSDYGCLTNYKPIKPIKIFQTNSFQELFKISFPTFEGILMVFDGKPWRVPDASPKARSNQGHCWIGASPVKSGSASNRVVCCPVEIPLLPLLAFNICGQPQGQALSYPAPSKVGQYCLQKLCFCFAWDSGWACVMPPAKKLASNCTSVNNGHGCITASGVVGTPKREPL